LLWYVELVKSIHPQQLDEDSFALRTNLIASRANEVRHHFYQIVTSRAFNRSRRSCEFLQHVIDKTLAGELDELKERVIGVQLFGRNPSYDTGEDAIVRVTATDVRRRLKRFYDGTETNIRLGLPPGSYIVELIEQASLPEVVEITPSRPLLQPVEMPSRPAPRSVVWRRLLPVTAVLMMLGLSLALYYYRMQSAKANRLPWSVMLPRQGALKIVFSDPEIVILEGVIGSQIALADYANHHYLPPQQPPPSDALKRFFWGNNISLVDTKIAMEVGSLLPSSTVDTYRARSLQSQDFETGDNFLLLGSPFSNPWVALFQDRLDFYFGYDPVRHNEVIYNRRVDRGEAAVYVPTPPGGGGQAFAVIGLLANQNQMGHILILAGTNATATEAAGKVVTDGEFIVRILQEHGIDVHDRTVQFEILLRVNNTMAPSLSTFDVVACHRLS